MRLGLSRTAVAVRSAGVLAVASFIPTASAFAALVGDGNPAIPALGAPSLSAEVSAGTFTFDPQVVAGDRPVMRLVPVSDRRLADMQARAARFADGENQSN
jgi:hypothetical protein